jgi:replicative DNA helicase
MLTNESNYLDIDLEYLEKVVFKNCLEDEMYLNSIIDNLNYKFFKNKDFQQIVKIIQALYKRNNRRPTNTELEIYLNTSELKGHYQASKKIIDTLEVDLSNDILYSYTEKFLQEQAVFNTFLEIVDNKERDVKSIHDKFSKACNISLTTNIGHNYFKDVEQHIIDLTTREETIKTGWDWLDTRLGGGFLELGRSMYIFAGPTNVGKSIFLSNIASNAAAADKNVLVVSLEMSEMIYCKRITSKLTGLPINHLDEHIETLKEKVGKFKMTHPRANIIIKEFAPSSITPPQLEGFIKKLINKKFKPDIIVLDYLNLLASTYGNNSYERVKSISEQVRAMSYTFECPIISATQVNRTGYGNTTSAPGLEAIGESYGLGATADVIVSIWRTEEDEEDNALHMGIIKNRFGSNTGSTRISIDYNTLTLMENNDLNINEDVNTAENDAVQFGRVM